MAEYHLAMLIGDAFGRTKPYSRSICLHRRTNATKHCDDIVDIHSNSSVMTADTPALELSEAINSPVATGAMTICTCAVDTAVCLRTGTMRARSRSTTPCGISIWPFTRMLGEREPPCLNRIPT